MVQGAKKYVACHISYVLFQTWNKVHHSQNASYTVLEENNLSLPFSPPTNLSTPKIKVMGHLTASLNCKAKGLFNIS